MNYNLNFFNQYYTLYSKPELKSGIDIYIHYNTNHFIDFTEWVDQGEWDKELSTWRDHKIERTVLGFRIDHKANQIFINEF